MAAIVDERNRALVAQHADFGEGTAPISWPPSPSPVAVSEGLPGRDEATPSRWLLTFVQGYRQTIEYALQAAVLGARRESRLVAGSDLLLHCNNAHLSAATLLRFLARYPHRTRALLHSADNSQGYRCGHLQAVAST